MEEALKENEEKYRLYFENISDVIYFLDTDFRLLSISPTVEKILGYKPEELIGKQIQEMNVLAPEYLPKAFSNGMWVIAGEIIPPSVYEFLSPGMARGSWARLAALPWFTMVMLPG